MPEIITDRDKLIAEIDKNSDSQQELIKNLADLVIDWSNIGIQAWTETERLKTELLVKRTEEDKVKYWTSPWTWV